MNAVADSTNFTHGFVFYAKIDVHIVNTYVRFTKL